MMELQEMLELEDIKVATKRLQGVVVRTGLEFSRTFSEMVGGEIYLKTENLQLTGSFKIRGAYNKIAALSDEEKSRGVIAASAGNHAQGVALGAARSGINSTIIMPKGAPISKIEATKNYGAKVILSGDNYDEAYQKAQEIRDKEGSTYIHAFDDPAVIAGQGTIGLEILADRPDVDYVFVPVGGGGLISGVATAIKSVNPRVKIIGVEAVGAACALSSHIKGQVCVLEEINTIADGIAVKRPGDLNFKIIEKYVDELITVDDEEIASTILALLERSKMVVEAAGAAGLAGMISGKTKLQNKIGVAIISGGNIDTTLISTIIERGLIKEGRRINLQTILPDLPGALSRLLKIIAEEGANILSVLHNRLDPALTLRRVSVDLSLETRNRDHCQQIISRLKTENYQVNERSIWIK